MEAGRVSAVTGQQGYQEGIIFSSSRRGDRRREPQGRPGEHDRRRVRVILLGLVQNILDLSQVSNYWIEAVTGGVILVALILARIIGGEAAAE